MAIWKRSTTPYSVLWMLWACAIQAQPEIQQVATDHTPPTLAHEPVPRVVEGQPFTFVVHARDDFGVDQLRLLYRRDKFTDFQAVALQAVEGGRYEVTLQPDELVGPTLEYYIEAVDRAGNVSLSGTTMAPLAVEIVSPEHVDKKWRWAGLVGAIAVAAYAILVGAEGGDSGADESRSPGSPDSPGPNDATVTFKGIPVPSQ